ncbi:YfaZ family outer membrane protein [Cobetia sp. L2A1]|uniref:YfaZ family outer membrane protein n=1 Tax=Cobetia sp. L2A1 TaxID=2686360 RepID=UPI0018EED970|nr:YfaZ family outer membrane protein [Cobetia sp. L2A1]
MILHRNILGLSAAIIAASLSAPALAGNADLNLNSEAVQGELNGEISNGVQIGGGILSSNDHDDVTAGHVQLLGTERTSEYDVGLGARWSQYDTEHGDGGGLGLGGYGYYYLPGAPRVSLGGYGYVTPDVVTSNDLEHSYEYGLRARYQVIDNVEGYVGYRKVKADFENRDERTLDSGPLVGMRLQF